MQLNHWTKCWPTLWNPWCLQLVFSCLESDRLKKTIWRHVSTFLALVVAETFLFEGIPKLFSQSPGPMCWFCKSMRSEYLEANLIHVRLPACFLDVSQLKSILKESNIIVCISQFHLIAFCPSDQRNEELPTLLHFAAKYGLKKLTTVLLQCPGALQAYSVMNKSGAYPNTLAEKSGFSDLRQFMDEFVVSPAVKAYFYVASSDCVGFFSSLCECFLMLEQI